MPEPPKLSERPQSHLSHLSHFAMDACAVVMVGIAIFGAVLLTMNASTRVGEEQARQDAACPRCLQSELTLDGHDSIIGRIIRCSDSHCIVQSEDQVLVLRLENIKRVTNPPASADAIGHAMAP